MATSPLNIFKQPGEENTRFGERVWRRHFAVYLPFWDLFFHVKVVNRGIPSISFGIDHSYSREFTVTKQVNEEPT